MAGKKRDRQNYESAVQRAQSEAFASAVRAGRYDEVIDRAVREIIAEVGARTSLEEEIGALRLVLQRAIALEALDGDLQETVQTVTRLVDAISRATRVQRATSGDLSDDLSDALTTILIEMGLGGGEYGGE